MKATYCNVGMGVLMGIVVLLLVTVDAAPMELDDEQSENALVRPDNDPDLSTQWETIDTAALRKLLKKLDDEDRMIRATRTWPQPEPRGWGVRDVEGRLARPWRTDKRQVRFRQCYFNPISCFRK
uniref:Allatostatin n=1 Tax=Samia ricini TaxID=63990 RepID=Q4PLI0_SAMRI|nr:allatostatin [Samia ricini]